MSTARPLAGSVGQKVRHDSKRWYFALTCLLRTWGCPPTLCARELMMGSNSVCCGWQRRQDVTEKEERDRASMKIDGMTRCAADEAGAPQMRG